jgi:hypothetical protein
MRDLDRDRRFERRQQQDDDDWYNGMPGQGSTLDTEAPRIGSTGLLSV